MFYNLGDCGNVFPWSHVTKTLPYEGTKEFDLVTYHCKDGFIPSGVTAQFYCKKDEKELEFKWVPLFGMLQCTELKLMLHEQSKNLICPWDFVSYKCIVNSSDVNVYLKWYIKYPGFSAQSIIYDRNSIPNKVKLPNLTNVTLTLNDLQDGYIESTIELTPKQDIDLSRVQLKCSTILDIEKSITVASNEIPLGMILILCIMRFDSSIIIV